jgi:hypothetical protein
MRKTTAEKFAANFTDGHHWNEAEAQQVLDAWDASGESGAGFARRLGIDPQRLHWWRRRLGRRTEKSRSMATTSPAFIPVVIGAGDRAAEGVAVLVVDADGGVRIEVRQVDSGTASWVAVLLTAMREAQR